MGNSATTVDSLSISHKGVASTSDSLSIEFQMWSYFANALHPNPTL
jgi:hypothetical protein